MTKYRLHNRLGSGGFVIQAILSAAGVPFDYTPMPSRPNEPLGARVHDLNAWGQVPVLEMEGGAKLTEVAAMLTYLSRVEPSLSEGPVFWIDDEAMFHRWAVFLAVNVYEGVLRDSYAHRYFNLDHADQPAEIEGLVAVAVRKAAADRVHLAFQCIEKETADHAYLLSDRLSPCDVFLAMLYAWHKETTDLPKCEWITTQVATHDAIRPIWAQNFHDRMEIKWHEK